MKKSMIALVALLFTSYCIMSCDKKDPQQDNELPTVENLEPENNAILKIGGDHGVHFSMTVRDNKMLKGYKLEIHNNFDHHTHSASVVRHEDNTVPFTFMKTYDLSGKKLAHIHHHDIVIPENATPGDYHLMVYVSDEAGNETVVSRDIVLSHDADDHHDHDHDHDHE